jgi:hypothetical protein
MPHPTATLLMRDLLERQAKAMDSTTSPDWDFYPLFPFQLVLHCKKVLGLSVGCDWPIIKTCFDLLIVIGPLLKSGLF